MNLRRRIMANNVGSALNTLLTSGLTFYAPFADAGSGAVSLVASGAGASQAATFTRATTATTVNSAGLIVSVASGVARSYYDPSTLAYQGYLAEGARTNIRTRSEDLSDATAWPTKTDITLAADNTTAPDGAVTADRLTEGSAGTAILVSNAVTVTDGTTVTQSIFAKRSSGIRWLRFRATNSAGSNGGAVWADIENGVMGSAANTGSGTATSGTLKAYPNGWYRITITTTLAAGDVTFLTAAHSASADGGTTRVSNSVYWLWGAQVENASSFASSYIPTTTAAVTRNADVLTYAFSGNADGAAGSAYAELSTQWTTSGSAAASKAINFAADSSHVLGAAPSVADTLIALNDLTANTVKSGLTQMSTGVRKRASSWGSAGAIVTGEGATVATGTFDGGMGSTAIGIGCRTDGVTQWYGTLRNIRIWQTQFTDAQLSVITS